MNKKGQSYLILPGIFILLFFVFIGIAAYFGFQESKEFKKEIISCKEFTIEKNLMFEKIEFYGGITKCYAYNQTSKQVERLY